MKDRGSTRDVSNSYTEEEHRRWMDSERQDLEHMWKKYVQAFMGNYRR